MLSRGFDTDVEHKPISGLSNFGLIVSLCNYYHTTILPKLVSTGLSKLAIN